MSAPARRSFTDFTASDLPTEKWLKIVSPKVRLHVKGETRSFISSVVRADNRGQDDDGASSIHWTWHGDSQPPRPSFVDDEEFEIVVERKFLLRYKCIRRTRRVSISDVPTQDSGFRVLSLYDGKRSAETEMDAAVEIGTIQFALS